MGSATCVFAHSAETGPLTLPPRVCDDLAKTLTAADDARSTGGNAAPTPVLGSGPRPPPHSPGGSDRADAMPRDPRCRTARSSASPALRRRLPKSDLCCQLVHVSPFPAALTDRKRDRAAESVENGHDANCCSEMACACPGALTTHGGVAGGENVHERKGRRAPARSHRALRDRAVRRGARRGLRLREEGPAESEKGALRRKPDKLSEKSRSVPAEKLALRTQGLPLNSAKGLRASGGVLVNEYRPGPMRSQGRMVAELEVEGPQKWHGLQET